MRVEPTVRSSGTRKGGGTAALLRRFAILLVGAGAALVVTEYSARFVVARMSASSVLNTSAQGPGQHVPVNSLGFREREIGPKRPDQYRIIVIGDSYTWGQALEERERFSNLLEGFLGPQYEV